MSEVQIDISNNDLAFTLEHIDWSIISQEKITLVVRFLQCLLKHKTSYGAKVPYSVALASVRVLLSAAVKQYEQLEHHFESV
jgi:hypothetical protein